MNWVLFLFFALPAAYAIAAAVPYGPGITPDSVAYFSIANHIAAGKGVWSYYSHHAEVSGPIAAWPPLYPAILSIGVLLKIPVAFGQIVNGFLFGLNCASAAYMTRRATGSLAIATAAGLAFCLHPVFADHHFWLLSEPLFVALILWSCFGLWLYAEKGDRRFLFAAAAAAGLIPLVRYIGLAYVVSGALTVALFARQKFTAKVRAAAAYGVIASIPLSVWLLRNFVVMERYARAREELGYRLFGSLVEHAGGANSWTDNALLTLRSAGAWLARFAGRAGFSDAACEAAAAIAAVAAAGLGGMACLKPERMGRAVSFAAVHAVGAVVYAGVFNLSLWYSGFAGGFGERYTVSIFVHGVFVLICGSVGAAGVIASRAPRAVRIIAIGTIVLMMVSAGIMARDSARQLTEHRRGGVDRTSGALREMVRTMPWFPTQETLLQYRRKNQTLGRWR